MKLMPYKAEHAMSLLVREVEKPTKGFSDFEEWSRINEGPFSFSAISGNEVIACGGVRELWEGVGEAWALLGVGVIAHRISVARVMKLKLGEASDKFHRIQAHARMDFSIAHMFLRKLGFEEEGYMRAYYPDKMDAILYSIVEDK